MEFGVIGSLEDINILKLFAQMHGWIYLDSKGKTTILSGGPQGPKLYRLEFNIINYIDDITDEKSLQYIFHFANTFYEIDQVYDLPGDKDEVYNVLKTYGPHKI